jgi:hypothetical protein
MMNVYFRGVCLTALIGTFVQLSNADTISFSFNGGGVTSSGTLTIVAAPDNTSGVATPDTYEITGITGKFADTNDGISGTISGLYTPISYVSGLAATAANPVAFTTAGLSYDDLFFAGANASADCPGYPFGGGYFDVYGVAFNISGGYVGEFFSDGILPGKAGPLYAAADANSTSLLDNPNAGSHTLPVGVLGSFSASPEPNALRMLACGVFALALIRFAGGSRAQVLK